jgi:hypothetical protein
VPRVCRVQGLSCPGFVVSRVCRVQVLSVQGLSIQGLSVSLISILIQYKVSAKNSAVKNLHKTVAPFEQFISSKYSNFVN